MSDVQYFDNDALCRFLEYPRLSSFRKDHGLLFSPAASNRASNCTSEVSGEV